MIIKLNTLHDEYRIHFVVYASIIYILVLFVYKKDIMFHVRERMKHSAQQQPTEKKLPVTIINK